MRALLNKLKPAKGVSHFAHIGLNVIFPLVLFVLVRIFPVWVALLLLFLSKWRMFAVRPRYWPVHVRINAVDLMVGVSIILFMAHNPSEMWQIFWAISFGLWLVFFKPLTGVLGVALQAIVGQTAALMAIFSARNAPPTAVLVIFTWIICYLAARHFFGSFEEVYGALYSHIWAYFSGAFVWIVSHWLLFYATVGQPTLVLTLLSMGLGSIYYLDQTQRLSILVRRQFVVSMVAVIVAVLALSDWSSKIF